MLLRNEPGVQPAVLREEEFGSTALFLPCFDRPELKSMRLGQCDELREYVKRSIRWCRINPIVLQESLTATRFVAEDFFLALLYSIFIAHDTVMMMRATLYSSIIVLFYR